MGKSISQLKDIVKRGEINGLKVYQEELNHHKKHSSMNITAYNVAYSKILMDIGIDKPYDKLNETDKAYVINYMENKYEMSTFDIKLKNTVDDFKAPELKFWLLISAKK